MPDELTIDDLVDHSGLSTRTLHYYMTKGLLPGPETRGKYASYTQEHLDRLDLIIILKELRLSLYEIKLLLDQLTPEEIRQYRDHQGDLLERIKGEEPGEREASPDAQRGSALEYLKGLEETQAPYQVFNQIRTTRKTNRPSDEVIYNDSIRNLNIPIRKQELWRRVILADGIELHIRESAGDTHRYYVDRLLKFAHSLQNQKDNLGRDKKDEK